jgi:hypothetical protein
MLLNYQETDTSAAIQSQDHQCHSKDADCGGQCDPFPSDVLIENKYKINYTYLCFYLPIASSEDIILA